MIGDIIVGNIVLCGMVMFSRTLLRWKTYQGLQWQRSTAFQFLNSGKHPPSCLYCKSHYAPERPPTNLPSTNTSHCDTLIITSCIRPIPSHEYVMPRNESYSHSRRPTVNKYNLSITRCPVKNYWKPTEADRRQRAYSQQEKWKLLYVIFKEKILVTRSMRELTELVKKHGRIRAGNEQGF